MTDQAPIPPDDQSDENDSQDDAEMQGIFAVLHDRLAQAEAGFRDLNRAVPEGQQQFLLPPNLDLASTVNVLIQVVINAGAVTEEQFALAKLDLMATTAEELLEQARQARLGGRLFIPASALH